MSFHPESADDSHALARQMKRHAAAKPATRARNDGNFVIHWNLQNRLDAD
jgi:hypothetical protein